MKRILKFNFRRFLREPFFRLSVLLSFIVIVISTGLLSLNIIGTTYDYRIGDISREDIRTNREIKYIIESETEIKTRMIAETTPLVFDRDQSVLIDNLKKVEKLFVYVTKVLKENPPYGTEDRTFQLIALKDILPKNIVYRDRTLWNLLKNNNPVKLRRTINRIMIFIFDKGIMESDYENPLNINNHNVSLRTINISEETNEISARLDDLISLDQTKNDLYKICYSISTNKSDDQLYAVYNVLYNSLRPNLKFNIEETRRRINEKIKYVKPVIGILKKGQMLAREGDTITTESLCKIDILNKNTATSNVTYMAGIFLLLLTITLISIFFYDDSDNKALQNTKTPIIIFSLVIIFILSAFFLSRAIHIQNTNFNFALLLPIPFVIMTIATLFSERFIAMFVGVFIVFFTFIISHTSFPTMVIAFSSVILGIIVIRNIERRTDFLRGGFILGTVNSIILISIGLMEETTIYNVLKNIQLSYAHGIFNSILVMGVFPIYENLFGVTTRFKLLELSDLNAKIFKRMLIKAPGTYNHSLIVANMAEAACEAIGANSILARVGGYYHDIGKLANSKFYVENQGNNLHGVDLSPEEYSKLIISHIETGVELAKENNLPDSIIDFIKEHHGTSTMTYFYHQALEVAENTGGLNDIQKKSFQYPGPKPHNRETAIVMLADSVEAASRSLQEPTSIKLEGLVKKIIYNKLNDGELENSNLNMLDLKIVQKSILRVLNGVFHTRLEYPEDADIKKLEKKALNNSKNDSSY